MPLTLPPRFARAPSLSPQGEAPQERRLKGAGGRGVGAVFFPLLSALWAFLWLKIGSFLWL